MRVVPSQSETERLLCVIDPRDPFGPRDRALVELAMHTGLRVSELAGLDVFHVAHQGVPRQTLHLPRSITKGARERTVPLNQTARRAIANLLAFNQKRGFSVAAQAPLFVTRKHERVSVRLIQRLIEELRQRAGLDAPLTPHGLRHLFATQVTQATGNLRIVQKLLGHRKLNTTAIYSHPTSADLAAAVQAISGGAPRCV